MIPLLAFQAICNSKDPRIEAVYQPLLDAMDEFDILTPQRQAVFIAQTAFESMRYTHLEEIASGQAYENRADLGNTQPGDGVKFKGRGCIQITGRTNYGRCSSALFGLDSLLLDSPWKLAQPGLAARSAGWFWDWKRLNQLCDVNDFDGVTRRINGGLNGIVERRTLWTRARYALGVVLQGQGASDDIPR